MKNLLKEHWPKMLACGVGLAFCLLLGACKPSGPSAPHTNIESDGKSLRDKFNADVGKVRVVMLVAPT